MGGSLLIVDADIAQDGGRKASPGEIMPPATIKQPLPVVDAPRLGDIPLPHIEEPMPGKEPWASPLRPPKHPRVGFDANRSAGEIERLLGLA
jgi:hypothetical protein